MYITCDAVTAKFLILAATLTSVLAWKMLDRRTYHLFAEGEVRMMKERRFLSVASLWGFTHPCLRKSSPLSSLSLPAGTSNGIPRCGIGERARFFWWRTACNTWQYLVSGPRSPAGSAVVFLYARSLAIRCECRVPSKSSGDTHRGCCGHFTLHSLFDRFVTPSPPPPVAYLQE